MKIKVQLLTLFIVTLFLFTSCEWSSDESNYIEVAKPAQEIEDPRIELLSEGGSINPQETIQLMSRTNVYFEIFPKTAQSYSSVDYKIGNLVAYWGNDKINDNWSWGYGVGYAFNFNIPSSYQDGEVREMKVELDVIRSLERNPASLSDKLPREYRMTYLYDVMVINEDRIIDNFMNSLTATQDKDGFLKLGWDKPKVNIEKIQVYSDSYQFVGEVTDSSEPNVIDKKYIGGYANYTLIVYLKNTIGNRNIYIYKTVYNPMLEQRDIVTTRNGNKIKITWQNPNSFPTKYVLEIGDNVYHIPIGQNSLELEEDYLNGHYYYGYGYIYSLPIDKNYNDYSSSHYTYFYLNN